MKFIYFELKLAHIGDLFELTVASDVYDEKKNESLNIYKSNKKQLPKW